MNAWTIYHNPTDYPGKWVARRFANALRTEDHLATDSLESARDWIHQEAGFVLTCFPRDDRDEPQKFETWM